MVFLFSPSLQGYEQHHVDVPRSGRRMQHGRRRPAARETRHAGQEVEVALIRIGRRPAAVSRQIDVISLTIIIYCYYYFCKYKKI